LPGGHVHVNGSLSNRYNAASTITAPGKPSSARWIHRNREHDPRPEQPKRQHDDARHQHRRIHTGGDFLPHARILFWRARRSGGRHCGGRQRAPGIPRDGSRIPRSPWWLQAGIWITFWASYLSTRWALADQRARCPVCLRRLAHPVRMGNASRILLEWNGTELICTRGHGLLHVPDSPAIWFSKQRWLRM
jgi:hypothetical protein